MDVAVLIIKFNSSCTDRNLLVVTAKVTSEPAWYFSTFHISIHMTTASPKGEV